jgi:hypothetical protein
MKKLIEEISNNISKDIDSHLLVKRNELFIPFMEIGIQCLIRSTSEINIFYETIMKLIDIDVNEINEMSALLGLEYNVIKEVVVDMVEGDYIWVSENKFSLTQKGLQTLKSRKLVEINKRNINRVFVDLITGEIHDSNSIKTVKINPKQLSLDKVITVNKSFLDNNFKEINRILQKQIEDDKIFTDNKDNRELYKVIDVSYQNFCYAKNELQVFLQDNSQDVVFRIKNDIHENYLNSFFTQAKSGIHPCIESLFEKDWQTIQAAKNNHFTLETKKLEETKNLRLQFVNKLLPETLSRNLSSERYLLYDTEYLCYFKHFEELIFDKVIIVSNKLNNILNQHLVEAIELIIKQKEVHIYYSSNEYNISKTLDYYFDKFKANSNLIFTECKNLVETKIYFEKCLLVKIDYHVTEFSNKFVLFQKGSIAFGTNCTFE